MLHIALHFLLPFGIAATLYRKRLWNAFAFLMVGMLIDLDHLLATPIYDAERCSVGFHPLHSGLPLLVYLALMAHPRTRLVGMGLCLHILLDSVDCQITNGIWFRSVGVFHEAGDTRRDGQGEGEIIGYVCGHRFRKK